MNTAAADRNLLFGILAVQMDFITRDQLIAAMHAWVLKKNTPLGEVLRSQGTLDAEAQTLLDALVKKHLAHHGNDAHKSLATVTSGGLLRDDLERIADADLHQSLLHISAVRDPDATKPPDQSAGSTGLRFNILRPHLKGGLGQVSIALDAELRREVALKEIQERYADDPNARTRFLIEGEITGKLEHPGIVPVYSLGQYADGRPYYAMRFIQGESLKEAIESFHKAARQPRSQSERAWSFASY